MEGRGEEEAALGGPDTPHTQVSSFRGSEGRAHGLLWLHMFLRFPPSFGNEEVGGRLQVKGAGIKAQSCTRSPQSSNKEGQGASPLICLTIFHFHCITKNKQPFCSANNQLYSEVQRIVNPMVPAY